MFRTPTPPRVDRDSLTPLTALSARQALERTIRDVHALDGSVGSLAADMASTKQLSQATAEAVAAYMRRPRMTPAEIRTWFAGTASILAILVGGLTQWRVAQAGAASREGVAISAAQTYSRQAEADRERLSEITANLRQLREELSAFRQERREQVHSQ